MLSTLLSEGLEHVGAAGAGKFSPINPSSRMDNCAACTVAHIINKLTDATDDDVLTADQVERLYTYSGKQRRFTLGDALNYIVSATGTTSSETAFMEDPGLPGHYAVFPRVHPGQCTHVMYGEVRADGSRYLYDPQIGLTMTWDEMVGVYTGGAKTFHLKPKGCK